eukprot:scaffold85070_cov16-Prasinocladus_malaysianus.AAC.1
MQVSYHIRPHHAYLLLGNPQPPGSRLFLGASAEVELFRDGGRAPHPGAGLGLVVGHLGVQLRWWCDTSKTISRQSLLVELN